MTLELPGFFDLQVNGYAGVDFNDAALTPDRVSEALTRMRASGVTRCLPTLVTAPLDRFAAAARAITAVRDAAVVGIHMEGPYVSPEDGFRGAHARAYVQPAEIDDFRRRQDAADGRIVLVTLAPEVAGAVDLVEYLVAAGVRVAIGHTAASAEQIAAAVAAGATLATHLGNGCAQLLPRHPNPIWELLAADAVRASLIVDGHHLPPSTVKAMVRAKGRDRIVLVTDATAAAASPPGRYTIAGIESMLDRHGRVSLPGTPYLAGSALTMDRAVANTVRFTGLSIHEVIPMATTIPAACIGAAPAGSITADWNDEVGELHIQRIIA